MTPQITQDQIFAAAEKELDQLKRRLSAYEKRRDTAAEAIDLIKSMGSPSFADVGRIGKAIAALLVNQYEEATLGCEEISERVGQLTASLGEAKERTSSLIATPVMGPIGRPPQRIIG